MPTIVSHAVPALALGAGLGFSRIPPRLLAAAAFFAVAPDLDVLGFRFGVSYADLLGHRGFSHSLLFAVICGGFGAVAAPFLRSGRRLAFGLIFLAVASHIALDAATSGGLGVAAFWPLSEERYFLPWRPIRVSPFDPRAFLGARGLAVIRSELVWVWLPSIMMAVLLRLTLSARPVITDKHQRFPRK
jgi:Predicted membrane-bound metal-dependent hydrolases